MSNCENLKMDLETLSLLLILLSILIWLVTHDHTVKNC